MTGNVPILVVGEAYFLLGYLDKDLRVPFIQTLIYLEERGGALDGLTERDHVFVDAIAFHEAHGKDVGDDSKVWIPESGLSSIKDRVGLVDELRQQFGLA